MWRIIKRNALLATVTLLFLATGGYYFVRHLKPFTQNAFVVANTRPVSVLVEGYITEVHVVNNQFVKAGDPLFSVFRPPYQLKVDQLTHAIAAKEAELTSFEAQLKVVADQIRAKTAVLENDVYLSGRADEMYASEAISQAYAEERQQSMIKSEAELSASKNQEGGDPRPCDMGRGQIRQLKAEKELATLS